MSRFAVQRPLSRDVGTRSIALCYGVLLVGCGPEIAVPDEIGSSGESSTSIGEATGPVQPEASTSSGTSDPPDVGVGESSSDESSSDAGSSGGASIECTVPTTHATIQAAIDDDACPTVLVGTGTYFENVYVARDVTLEAIGDATIDGGERGSVIEIVGADVRIHGFTITGGSAEQGGGITTDGALDLIDTRVVANRATMLGGGIAAYGGPLVVEGCTIADNVVQAADEQPSAQGGGIWLHAPNASLRPITLVHSSVVDNRVEGSGFLYGGGIALFLGGDLDSEAWIVGSTLSGNTIAGSGFGSGGGIFAARIDETGSPRVAIASSTFAENSAQWGSALHLRAGAESDDAFGWIAGTVIAPTVDEDPCGFHLVTIESGGHNLDASGSCDLIGDTGLVGVDGALLPLDDNGGPTPTHALAPGSPAIDGGDPSGCTDPEGAPLGVDQRGAPRPVGAACDVGAVEM